MDKLKMAKKNNKYLSVLLIMVMLVSMLSSGAAFATGVPGVDFTPGELIVGTVEGVLLSKEEIANPASVFPGVPITSMRLLATYTNKQALLLTLPAESIMAMYETIKVLEQSPLLRYVEVNRFVKPLNEEPYAPTPTVFFTQDINGVLLTVGLEKTQFRLNEPIWITATAKNNTPLPVTIYTPDSSMRFFSVNITQNNSFNNRLIDEGIFGLGFAAVIGKRILQPGEAYSQTIKFITWNYPNGRLTPASPGIYDVTAAVWYQNPPITFSIEVLPDDPAQYGEVKGSVLSYNPQTPALVQLLQNDAVAYQTEIPPTTGTGQIKQDFLFDNVKHGTYTLVVTKSAHLKFILNNVVVGDENFDLARSSSFDSSRGMTLLCGDLDGDGIIDAKDLNTVWSSLNYGKRLSDADNKQCDLNGDGIIDAKDLNIIWSSENYGKRDVVVN